MFTLNALSVYSSNWNCITPLDYVKNKINSLFNQSQERKEKEKRNKQNAPRKLCNNFYMERNNVNKHGE